jgi:hypothetical protein
MIYGYARVSTGGQIAAARVRQLRTVGAKKVFREVAGGAKTDRPQLRRLLAQLDAGDVWRDALPDSQLFECGLAVLASRYAVRIGHRQPAASEHPDKIESRLHIDFHPAPGRCHHHELVAEQVPARCRLDKIAFLGVVHPPEIGQDEDVGGCTALDLLCELRAGGIGDYHAIMPTHDLTDGST